MILHWLHTAPAEDLGELADQVREAAWMERRYFQALGRIFGSK